jgi:pimeloyl-ACP methyl ester carboxylesterase
MAEHRAPGVVTWYDQFGSGPDVFFLSGGDNTGAIWHTDQVPAFAEDFRCTTYDARGVGRTESLEPPPWPIELYAADAGALIEAVCEPPVVLVGLSMGSLIAQELALERPDLVRCAVLIGTAAGTGWGSEPGEAGFGLEWMQAEVDLRRAGGRVTPEFAVAHYGALCLPPDVLGDDEEWARLRDRVADSYAERDNEGLAAQWQACVDYASLARLPGCRVPLHVIASTHDMQTPPNLGRILVDAAPDGHLHLFEGYGHLSVHGHAHEVLNPLIRGIAERYA